MGREQEITEIGSALASSRLVTLLGPGGVGKTRLAIEICKRLAGAFADGEWFLDLTGVSLVIRAMEPVRVGRDIRRVQLAGWETNAS